MEQQKNIENELNITPLDIQKQKSEWRKKAGLFQILMI